MGNNQTYEYPKNELLQLGATVTYSSISKNQIPIYLECGTKGGLFNNQYYVYSDKNVPADITCSVRIYSLFQVGGYYTATIKAGENESDVFATSTLWKLSSLMDFTPKSHFDEVEDKEYIYSFIGQTEKKDYLDAVLANNIKYDFRNGLRDASYTVGCTSFSGIDNELTVDWNKGEILKTNGIVYDEKDGTLWRITGRKFKKEGAPFVELELQQAFKEE